MPLIKLTPSEIEEGLQAVEKLAEHNIKGFRLKVASNLQTLRAAKRMVEGIRMELQEKHYMRDDNGDPVEAVSPEGTPTGSFRIEDPYVFTEALRDLRNESVDVQIYRIPHDKLKTAKSLPALAFWPPMIIGELEEDDEPEIED